MALLLGRQEALVFTYICLDGFLHGSTGPIRVQLLEVRLSSFPSSALTSRPWCVVSTLSLYLALFAHYVHLPCGVDTHRHLLRGHNAGHLNLDPCLFVSPMVARCELMGGRKEFNKFICKAGQAFFKNSASELQECGSDAYVFLSF